MRIARKLKRANGQSLVEFALAIPFILLVLVAVMYFGRVFYIKQMVSLASQEGVRALSRVPNLSDPAVREFVVGYTADGVLVNPDSVVVSALGSANLLSDRTTGNLPAGSKVRVLPYDAAGDAEDVIPRGTIAVRIEYPFSFTGDPFGGGANASSFGNSIDVWSGPNAAPISFLNFPISERAVAMPELYQEFP